MSTRTLTIALVAGEASGDILGASLIKQLQLRHPAAKFVGIAGPCMRAAGCDAWFASETLSVMGVVEVIGRLPQLLNIGRTVTRRLIALQPDIFIGIDAPDFNLPLEGRLKRAGIPTVHYVSPSIWAWRQRRVLKIGRNTNMVLALLPFEKAFYDRHNVACKYVGHTLADAMPLQADKARARVHLGITLEAPCLALLPGSRQAEVALLSADFLRTAQRLHAQHPQLTIVAPLLNAERRRQFTAIKAQVAPALPVKIVDGDSRQVMTASDAALLASGTAALECMLAKCPMVVAYRLNTLTWWLAKRLVKTPYISLPNLLANRTLVPELLQDACEPNNLSAALAPLLFDQAQRAHQVQAFYQLHEQIRCHADRQAADAILELMNEPRSSV